MAQNAPLIVRLLASSVSVASSAGKIVRDVMSAGNLGIVEKGKNDLQTEADRAAQRCIISSLSKQYPGVTIIGEEGNDERESLEISANDQDPQVLALKCPPELSNISDDQVCVWVDPLDGTSEYTQGLLEHVTVLIGVAVGKEPIAGVIHQPFYNYKSKGGEIGRTVWSLKGAGVGGLKRGEVAKGRIVTTTRSHSTPLVQEVLRACQPTEVLPVGGAGHKVMLLIEGKAHAYVFASSGSKRWDTCAPEAILRELGGELTDIHGNKYEYNTETPPVNTRGVLATALASEHASYVELVQPVVSGKLQ